MGFCCETVDIWVSSNKALFSFTSLVLYMFCCDKTNTTTECLLQARLTWIWYVDYDIRFVKQLRRWLYERRCCYCNAGIVWAVCVTGTYTVASLCQTSFWKKMRLQANELFVYKFQKYNIPYNYFAFWKRTNASKFVLCIIMISTYFSIEM